MSAPPPAAPAPPPRWLGAALLAALAWLAAEKSHLGLLGEMCWVCHPSALVLGLGVLLRVRPLAEAGAAFHLGPGIIGYSVDVLAEGTTTWPSLAVHLIAPLTALLLVRAAGLRPSAKWLSLVVCYAAFACARLFTAPALNVNLAFGPHHSFVELYGPYPWARHLTSAALLLGPLYAVERAVRALRDRALRDRALRASRVAAA